MKIKILLVIIAVIAVGLTIGLIKTNQDAANDHKELAKQIDTMSNGWSITTTQLEEQKQKSLQLETDKSNQVAAIASLSNTLSQANDTITQKEAAIKAAQDEKVKSDARIAELEDDNKKLDTKQNELQGHITTLNTQIADTQKKLDASEGDKAFLQKELTRMMAEKAELERKFNDLAVLKDQVHKLKEELSVSRRLQLIREGLLTQQDTKGAQRLMQSGPTVAAKPAMAGSTYDLNVEVKSDGSVKVIPPITPGVDPMSPIKQ